MNYKLTIAKDASGVTYGYEIVDDAGNVALTSDGFENSDAIMKELTELNAAISGGLNNIEKE